MIVFDCERMKYPNTGLYSYCDNVAQNLVLQKDSLSEALCMYVPSGLDGRWGDGVSYRNVCPLDKLYLRCPSGLKLWHSAHQQTSYVPPKHVKQVLTVHDLNFLYEKPYSKQRRYLNALAAKIDRADYLIAISQSTKMDILNNIDVKGKFIDVIYNGLNHFDGDVTVPAIRPEGRFIYTVGTVLPKKNFHVLPALLAGNDFNLIISGNKSPYVGKIMEEAQKYGVESRVFITGPVRESEKFWYIKHCSAFVFPSVAEGFGLPVLEAMYYKKPIFLSDHTSLPEIGGDNAFYFDHKFNPEKMRKVFNDGMKAFENGEVDTEKMVAHAQSFSWERTARKYIEIYREFVG